MVAIVFLLLIAGCVVSIDDIQGRSAEWLVNHFEQVEESRLRAGIVHEAIHFRDAELISFFCHALEDTDERVRKEAVKGLCELGGALEDKQRDAAYIQAIADSSRTVREAAVECIVDRFQEGRRPPDLLAQVVSSSRESKDHLKKLTAVNVLRDIEGKEIDDILMKIASMEDNARIREESINALGTRRVSSARGLLQRIRTTDLNQRVRFAAERALRKIGGNVTDLVIALLPFETDSTRPELIHFAAGLHNFIACEFSQARLARVINRSDLDRAISEIALQDRLSDERVIDIGRTLKADQILFGTIHDLGDTQILICIRRMEIDTHELLQGVNISGAIYDLDALQRDASSALLKTFRKRE